MKYDVSGKVLCDLSALASYIRAQLLIIELNNTGDYTILPFVGQFSTVSKKHLLWDSSDRGNSFTSLHTSGLCNQSDNNIPKTCPQQIASAQA